MSEDSNPPAPSFAARHHFLLRRLHSLTGIVPIGLFLINHLPTNSSVVWGGLALRGREVPTPEGSDGAVGLVTGGAAYFWHEVRWINDQVPHLLLVEIALWSAIIFHSALGLVYARSGKGNVARYAYRDNWRYALQRASGYFGIVFILYHVATLRWGWSFLVPGGTQWSHHYAASTLAAALRGGSEGLTLTGLFVSLFYLAGVSFLVFHFANGLWTAAITWGLTITASPSIEFVPVDASLIIPKKRDYGGAEPSVGSGITANVSQPLAGSVP